MRLADLKECAMGVYYGIYINALTIALVKAIT